MRVITDTVKMQRLAQRWRAARRVVGFVPTMGCLHDGHVSLIREARRRVGRAGRVVVSIFVNPTQFGPNEDLAKYPRDLPRDQAACRAAGVDLLFLPPASGMYAPAAKGPHSTFVCEEALTVGMEGAARPTHFRGVTTVVAKLFNLVLPRLAVFGAKDWQQAMVVKRMVRDLNFPVEIVVAPTVREPDGLAMSSRNRYLSAAERSQATILWRTIQMVRDTVRASSAAVPVRRLKARVAAHVASAPLARLDYVEFFDPEDLRPLRAVSRGARMALAVFVGSTRLIDNASLD